MSKFFSKLEKLDVMMIVFVIVVCFFATLVMIGWPEGEDWGLGWTSLAAIGGLAAGAGAFYAARVALKVAEAEGSRLREEKRQKALAYKWVFNSELNSIDATLNILAPLLREYASLSAGQSLPSDKASSINYYKKVLVAPIALGLLSEVYLFGEESGQAIAAIVSSLYFFHETLEALDASSPATTETLELARFIIEKIERKRAFYKGIKWPK